MLLQFNLKRMAGCWAPMIIEGPSLHRRPRQDTPPSPIRIKRLTLNVPPFSCRGAFSGFHRPFVLAVRRWRRGKADRTTHYGTSIRLTSFHPLSASHCTLHRISLDGSTERSGSRWTTDRCQIIIFEPKRPCHVRINPERIDNHTRICNMYRWQRFRPAAESRWGSNNAPHILFKYEQYTIHLTGIGKKWEFEGRKKNEMVGKKNKIPAGW